MKAFHVANVSKMTAGSVQILHRGGHMLSEDCFWFINTSIFDYYHHFPQVEPTITADAITTARLKIQNPVAHL
jgi:hypothetical protein